jgi:hypothetical protein
MKKISVYLLCVVTFCGLILPPSLSANLEGRERDGVDKWAGKNKEMRRLQPEGRRKMSPKPFLMAGDPRFENMLRLALVDEDKLAEAIEKWPKLDEMSEMEKRQFTKRVEMFRGRIRKEALQEATALALEIPEQQQVEYLRSYWEERIRVERAVRQQAEKDLDQKMETVREKLRQQWSGR